MKPPSDTRRGFLRHSAGALFATLASPPVCGSASAAPASEAGVVGSITSEIVFNGREKGVNWFHPRCCVIPNKTAPRVFMTLQSITGSDYYQAVHWMTSDDLGHTWTKPAEVPGLGRVEGADGLQDGVCDVVPQWHAATRTVLAMGHNIHYRGGKLTQPSNERWPVYSVMAEGGEWVTRRAKLNWDDPRGSAIYSCGCGQREVMAGGDLLVPISYGPKGRANRNVSTLLCAFDGRTVTPKRLGTELSLAKGRGLLEPSVVRYRDSFLLTIRAEDGHGYVSASNDGLDWRDMKPWTWNDGAALDMSTTQQHWLAHSDALHLVYTRKTPENSALFRWRAPLFMAEVDTSRMCLRRETERVVLPMVGDGSGNPKKFALMGNFHTVAVDPQESWVTVGEETIISGGPGNLLLARIHWTRPNTPPTA